MRPSAELNRKHASEPKIGDYWHEMLCGILVVLNVKPDKVFVCKEKINDKDGWYWDYSKIETMKRDEFAKYVRFDSIDGYWCDVVPERMKYAVEEAKAHRLDELI